MPARYVRGSLIPDGSATWRGHNEDGALAVIDLSDYEDFEIRVGKLNQEAVLVVDSGITGYATAPNLRWEWADGSLDDLAPAAYTVTFKASRPGDAKPRLVNDTLVIVGAVLVPAEP